MADKNEETKSAPPRSAQPSLLNVLMLYLSLMGIGAIGGYGAFYVMFSERCQQLMHETALKHNSSRDEWRQKYVDALEKSQQQCRTETAIQSELQELQGRMEAQSLLAEKHVELLTKQETTEATLEAAKQESEALRKRLAEQGKQTESQVSSQESLAKDLEIAQESLHQLTKKLQEVQGQKKTAESNLNRRLTETEKRLVTRAQKLNDLQEELEHCQHWNTVFEEQIQGMEEYLRNRSHRQCRMDYGRGPFQVQVRLRFPESMGEGPDSFVLELFDLAELPHTIYTFLLLIDLQVYVGTTFFLATDEELEGGSPNHVDAPDRSVKLHERYVKYGFPRSPLGMNEFTDKYSHEQYTISFSNSLGNSMAAGPNFLINMVDNSEEKQRDAEEGGVNVPPPFGKVVIGFDALKRIQTIPMGEEELSELVVVEEVRLLRGRS